MPCYKPITGFVPLEGGQVVFSEKKNCREVKIPCGGCVGCRLERIDAWGFRCMAEASLHRDNWFVTMTYDDEHLPVDESLDHRHWQLFAKRLRKRVGPFRFFMCGEYGENTQRAHLHALLFGCDISDLRKCNSVYSSHDLFESKLLNDVWGNGFCSVGTVTHESAKYVASYVMKRVSSELEAERFSWVTRFGELVVRKQPYGKMSLKPGIGADWLRKYSRDVANHAAVFDNQFRKKVPPYFRDLMTTVDPKAADDLEVNLTERGLMYSNPDNETYDRLAVRENVAKARIRFNKERFPNGL
ncbi:replication initiator protein [Chifec microvirus UA13_14]|nr:replication initiator protein [Chifec microvirus UA13_14]